MVLAATLTLAAAANAAAPVSEPGTGDVLQLSGDALTFPTSTLDGGVEITAERVTLMADVLFAFGRARLGPDAVTAIRAAADALRERRPAVARVVGHTDARGAEAFNLALSRRRAAAVARALEAQLESTGIALRAGGRGERDPVAANTVGGRDDPRGRARNRRVEIMLR